MISDELTIRALLAACAAERMGFQGTAEAFLALARDSALEAMNTEPWLDCPPLPTDRQIERADQEHSHV